ncbi:histidine phosphatase family protein [Micromonospora sp. NPDC085948]|uniref:histidine phosphatase family protein n=1 Tax=Micromonospora sp. NPDC085948 TaxID=3155293 RepID=UPI00342063FE
MPVTSELILVRHGEANNNVTGTVGGEHGCTGLSPRGRQQVEQVAARLAAEHRSRPFDVLCGTPRRRVRESIEIIGKALQMPPIIQEDLRGPDHGAADGQPWTQIKTAFGGPPQHHPDQPYAAGSETWNQYLDRATNALRDILSRHPEGRILIVAHGETIEAAHVLFLQPPARIRPGIAFVTDHTCISRWQQQLNRFNRRTWQLVAHNDTSHLAEHPR